MLLCQSHLIDTPNIHELHNQTFNVSLTKLHNAQQQTYTIYKHTSNLIP
jgi:hypothetical protein